MGPRSYVVKMGNRTFVRNRRHLIKSKDTREEDMPEAEDNIKTKNPESSPPVESETSSEEASTPQHNNTPRYEAPSLALGKPQKPRINSEQAELLHQQTGMSHGGLIGVPVESAPTIWVTGGMTRQFQPNVCGSTIPVVQVIS